MTCRTIQIRARCWSARGSAMTPWQSRAARALPSKSSPPIFLPSSLALGSVAVDRRDATPGRLCQWCHKSPAAIGRRDSKFCSKLCRQASWRFVVAPAARDIEATDRPMHFAYADPPYPGKAYYYPENREVSYASLLERLVRSYSDGWALSVSSSGLSDDL